MLGYSFPEMPWQNCDFVRESRQVGDPIRMVSAKFDRSSCMLSVKYEDGYEEESDLLQHHPLPNDLDKLKKTEVGADGLRVLFSDTNGEFEWEIVRTKD
jgi:hypothetical protein